MKENRERDNMSRRRFLRYTGIGAGTIVGMAALDACGVKPTMATTATPAVFPDATPTGKVHTYTFNPAPAQVEPDTEKFSTWAYNNGSLPGPEIRVNVGDTIRATVNNHLSDGTTIHWHGLPIVNAMDGVPDVTQSPIEPGKSFTYDFVVPVSGTYWYHSHVGLQFDRALYGPLIVDDPKETKNYDQDIVLTLDDWLDGVPGGPGNPQNELNKLIAGHGMMTGMSGMGSNSSSSMSGMGSSNSSSSNLNIPPDVIYPYYLINGKTVNDPYTITAQKGQQLRLRFINASAASIYHIALNGHRMTVTHTDGQPVEPVEVDALRIGMGERYDVLVTANNPGVWQLAAQVEGANVMGRALLRYQGSTATAPAANFMPPELNKQMLTYAMLKAAEGSYTPPAGTAEQQVPIALTGGDGEYVWKINNQVYPHADQIKLQKDRLTQFQFSNPSQMPHPMHLHGHFFQLDNGTGRGPMKDTVIVDSMQKMNINWVTDNPGLWAFHCHNLYHQATGMMRVVNIPS